MQTVKKNKCETVTHPFEKLVMKKIQEQMINEMQKMENELWNLTPGLNAASNNK
jgi:hypothetical protein